MCKPGAHGGEKTTSDPPETGVIDSCELPHGCWELNLDPL